ncbi:hypothetical protein C8A03DRAFT_19066 [Achaetomium macrosporum]|uniref:Uncharacterized protein n=1 Tax=Achaetomium macrosporum TaxID=79813 RepID=A0AAN7C3S7_9PEZI|nr:hypothetical protein C8A03DRAFT_19066 [Achaetomium macrosporum]
MQTPRATILDQPNSTAAPRATCRSHRPGRSFSNVATWTRRPGVLALRVPAPALVNLSELVNAELDATVAHTV